MTDRLPPSPPERGNEFSIDLQELKQFVCSRLWLVFAIILAVEALLGMASTLTTKGYRAEMLIRMGRSVNLDAGAQGGVIKRVRQEMASLPVTLEPRPNGTVMITAEGDSPEQATPLVQRVSERLMDYDGQALERSTALQHERIKFVEDSIGQLDAEIRSLMAIVSSNRVSENVVGQLGDSMSLKHLLELRHELRSKLVKDKAAMIENCGPAYVIEGPAAQAKLFRPKWLRNLALGAVFGLVFGFFVVGLMGVFRQLGAQARP